MPKFSTADYTPGTSNAGAGYLPPGKHRVTIDGQVNRGYANSGNEFIEVTFRNDAGKAKRKYWITERAINIFFDLVAAANGSVPPDIDTDDDGQLRELLDGREVEVVIGTERGQDGNDYTVVKFVNALAAGNASPAPAAHPASSAGDGVPF